MKLENLKAINDGMLRGGFCAVWIAAFILTAFEFIFAYTSDALQDQASFYTRMLVGAIIGIIAIAVHAYLIHVAE